MQGFFEKSPFPVIYFKCRQNHCFRLLTVAGKSIIFNDNSEHCQKVAYNRLTNIKHFKNHIMRKLIYCWMLLMPPFCIAQGGLGIGLKAGYNFANVTNAASINNSSQAGFLVGLFLAPSSKGIITSRHEFIYSWHGYNFDNGSTLGSAN